MYPFHKQKLEISQICSLQLRKLCKKMELPFSDSLKNNMKGILNAQNDNRESMRWDINDTFLETIKPEKVKDAWVPNTNL